MKILRSLPSLLLLLAATPSLPAHNVWIEDLPAGRLVIRFGEPGDKTETSPGYLDNLALPAAWKSGGDGEAASLVVEKKSDHFLLVGIDPADTACGETRFPVMKRSDRPASWPQFYMRWHPAGAPAPAAPTLTLDILPAGAPGEFRVLFRGRPLAGAQVGVDHLGAGAGANLTADDAGLVRYRTTTPGLVLLTSNHKETSPGFAAGAAYEVTSHNAALTWRQP